ncbi:MAG: hypothetical protein JWM25_387 [Thermoleophilia bacterium]|nr:hypothetical protein [Thermoleophilia bacterium]
MDTDRQQRDDATRAQHQAAVAAGEQRVLMRTKQGELHSYGQDEFGFFRGGSDSTVSSAFGLLALTWFFTAVAAGSLFLVVTPTTVGDDPLWGALLLTLGGVAGLTYSGRLARAELRARRVRRERGLPEPSSVQNDV